MGLKQMTLAVALTVAAAFAIAPQAQAAAHSIKLPAEAVSGLGQSDVIRVGNRSGFSVGFRFHSGHAYYNGYRGYHRYRRGYRKHRGYYFHPRAFIVVHPRRHVYFPRYRKPHPVRPRIIRLSHAHYRWCNAKYRSYRHSDNTVQPYHGPRKQCVSPYY